MRKRMTVALVVLACAGASALCAVGAALGESASQEGSVKLWAGGVVPRAAELERPAGIEFHVIKKNEPEVDGYNWLHGVALCWHKGRLYAYYGTNRGKENTANEEAHVRVSDDGGKTWGKVQVVAKGGNGLGISHGALASHNGELWCFAGAFSNKCSFVHTLAFTLDEAQGTWVPRGVVAGHGFWPMQGPLRMPDGNWIMGGLRVANGWNLPGGARPAAAISHGNDFAKWDVSVVEEGDVANIWGEATVDIWGQRVTLTMRPGWKANPSVAYVATSTDCGRSWTPLRPADLPLATSKPFTGILSTGQRYVISQTTSDGGTRRSPLTIAVSRPGEWAYSRVFLIRHAVFPEGPGASHPKAALAYPYAVEHDGKLYVGYSNSNGNDWNRNSAELAIMPVASLAVAPAGAVRLWPGDAFSLKRFPGGKWPGWHLDAAKGALDLRAYTTLEVAISNRTAHAVRVCVSVKGDALQGRSPEGALELPPSGEGKFVCDLKPEPWRLDKPLELVGMRGCPQAGGASRIFDLSRVSSIHIFRGEGDSPDDFEILSVKALDEKREQIVFKADGFLPFVDRFGQFKHLDWPGKVHAEDDLARAKEEESKWLAANATGPDPDRDEYGGWAKGPQLKATGYFRTEKVDGKWWFVDPKGRLFWSLGIDCLNIGEGVTGIGFREAYFEWLPSKDDTAFGQFYGKTGWKAAHGFYAETNHLPYATYNFAAANMQRKYGSDWRESSVDLAHRRLKAWGVNTVGNWSQPEIYLARRTPYTISLSTAGAPRLAGSKGWWGPLPDPGHPEFARKLRERARHMAAKMKDDPWCVGVFVDNELSWNDLPDLADVAERYYATVERILREELPNHLYLGSRIAWGSPEVYRACARHADVVSVNAYAPVFNRDLPADAEDKPLLNGEFHFGTLDRGLFHTGLVPVKDQAARAGAFKTYVRSCLENPRVIGTHWFQWKDQPLTGRSDGENYQIGFLNVADAPYPEMVEAVREVSATMYPSRTVKFEREILVEAEDFTKKGGWKVDTQFTHKMGSAYLIAASAGRPVADAVTAVEIPEGGVWRCWVRTKDWVPAHHPGRFAVSIGGKESRVLGVSGASGWRWEGAGEFALSAGKVELRLVDKSGWFARCDAVMLTKGDAAPPQVNRLDGPSGFTDGGEYDVVVVGAGTAGTCAAIAAARSGATVALVHDRPVLGGNASSEIKVQIEGASVEHPNARETGIIEEAQLLRLALGKNATISDALRVLAENERQLTVFDSRRVMRVEKDGRRMSAVLARGTLDGKWTRFSGKMFIDCTGDGWLGYYAGLPYMTGREARGEFAEAEAPDAADAATMSGCISDGRFRFNSVVRDAPVAFETPAWARVLPQGFSRKLKPVLHQYGGFSPMWWMEHPGDVDDFEDPEFARDELIRYYVAFWGWGKNEWEHRALLANEELLTIPFIDGRRETLRLVGDYVMTGNDEKSARMFPDRISYGGWPMDTHDPLGMKAVTSDGYWKHHPPLPIYSIPYRVLYSPALDNFFFAGRCQSATHMALGSIRVMSTLATLGQVCGTAAAECVRRGETPKDFGERHIAELQQRLIKDDLYIPAIENEDARDVARTAKATASSSGDRMYFRTSDSLEWFTKTHHIAHPSKRVGHDGWLYVEGATPQSVVDGISRPVLDIAHGWASDAAKPLPQWIRLDFAKPAMISQVRITFNSDLQQRKPDAPMPRTLAKAYRVEVLSGGEWRKVAEVKDNWRRLAVHDFPRCEAAAVRVTVTETWGDPRAQIFEIRAYDAGRGVAIDSGLPAGNIVFDGQDGDTVRIHQDLRDTFCEWFYWAFRVRGAAGRTLTFEFTDKSFDGGPVGVRGPVVSKDGGKTFSYPLDGKCAHGAFTYAFGADEDDVWFYECHPYGRENWDAFAAAHSSEAGKSFVAGTLCRSPKGADVPKARFGCVGSEPRHRVFMCARHHCSETMASWVLEGAAEAFMADDDLGRWLRENVELMMVPFVDYDGCMAGDQGKCRRPHDHNRDYTAFIYPETKAIADWIDDHAKMKLDVFLDIHCPGIRGREHECVHTAFMDPSIRLGSDETEGRFSALLERLQCGTMRYRVRDDIAYGTSWNNANTYKLGWGAALWACHKVKGAGVARSIEVPFANANGAVVTPETCRELGRDLAKTIKAYLEEQE